MLRIILPALAVAFLVSPALAQTRPDPACARPATPVIRAICADPALQDLDQSVARAFIAARARVDREALPALEKDQKSFLSERAIVLESKDMALADYLKNRISFLESIKSPAWGRDAAAFVGTWRNSVGEVRITRDADDRLIVAISTLSPAENRWICDIEGAAAPKNGRLEFSEEDVTIRLARRGSALVVADEIPQGDGGRPFCGDNGFIEGAYLKVD
ncbi:MAG: hypothetical protein ACRC7G_01050 [Beijerinckiaceae bacterium]